MTCTYILFENISFLCKFKINIMCVVIFLLFKVLGTLYYFKYMNFEIVQIFVFVCKYNTQVNAHHLRFSYL